MADAATSPRPPRGLSFFEALLERPDLVWMGQNTTHLEPPGAVIEALLESTRTREFQRYAPPLGLGALHDLIREDLGLPAMDVLVTDGAVGGLHHICTALAADFSVLITSDPGWPWPGRFAGLEGKPVKTLPVYAAEQGYKLSIAQVEAAIEPRSLLYLVDPLNPLGSRYTASEMKSLCDLARATRSLILHDCTYRHFADDHTLAATLYPEGALTTYSFSKWLGLAGLRLGAIVAAPDLLARLTAVPSNPLGANIQAQRAAIAGLRVKEAWLAGLRRINRANQATVAAAALRSGIGRVLVEPSHGNFVAIDLSASGWTGDGLAQALLDRDIFIRSGTYQSPAFGDRFVKVSTSVPTPWAERFADALAAVAQGSRPR